MVCGVYSVSEQEPGGPDGSSQLGLYVRRWLRWVRAGLGEGQVSRRNGSCPELAAIRRNDHAPTKRPGCVTASMAFVSSQNLMIQFTKQLMGLVSASPPATISCLCLPSGVVNSSFPLGSVSPTWAPRGVFGGRRGPF